MALQISKLTGSRFGARVSGISPGQISDVSDLRQLHLERLGLLCLEFDQLLKTEQLYALTTLFGDAEFAPGMITGYGKADSNDDTPVDIETQVAALRAEGRDPYLALLVTDSNVIWINLSMGTGNGTPICPISRYRRLLVS